MKVDEEKKAIEAALFTAAQPITVDEIMKVSEAESYGIALKLIQDVMKEVNKRDGSIEIVEVTSGKYQMKVKEPYADKVSHLAVDTEISKAVLRCLGLIAIKQPVKQSLVVRIIGNKAYNYVKDLNEKGFIKSAKAGTTKMLTTSSKFETYFGASIADITKQAKQSFQSSL